MAIVAPQINLNGSCPYQMVDDIISAREKIYEAMGAMSAIRPNARDYPYNPEHYKSARDQYENWFRDLDKIHNELMDLALAIQDKT